MDRWKCRTPQVVLLWRDHGGLYHGGLDGRVAACACEDGVTGLVLAAHVDLGSVDGGIARYTLANNILELGIIDRCLDWHGRRQVKSWNLVRRHGTILGRRYGKTEVG